MTAYNLHLFKNTLIFCVMGMGLAHAQPVTNGLMSTAKDQLAFPTVESKLSSCQGENPRSWNMCSGSFTFPNGNAYSGEWRNGQRDGVGKMRILAKGKSTEGYIGSATPSFYVGEFKGGQLNGHGVWIVDGGDRYEGEFANNILIKENHLGINAFGGEDAKFKKKCESYGLKFGTSDFAQCMIAIEQSVRKNAQMDSDRKLQKKVQQRDQAIRNSEQLDADLARLTRNQQNSMQSQQNLNPPSAIDWFRLSKEFATPHWIPDQCPEMLNARPGQYPGCK